MNINLQKAMIMVTNTNILIQRRKKQWKLEIPWLWIGTLEIRFGIGKNV